MPTIVVLERDGAGETRRFECPAGERLLDACDEVRTSIPFSCRSATCGTCLVDVLEGRETLEPPASAERELLVALAARPAQRLACQVVVRGAGERVVVRPVSGVEVSS